MARIGIGDRLNANSKKNIAFGEEYRKVRLDPRTLVPSEDNAYSQEKIEELADNMLLVGQLQEVIVGRVGNKDRIIVGHRRTAAAILNIERGHDEFKLIDCKVKEMSESLFMLTLHSANIFNRKLSDWELTNGVAEFTKYLIKAKESGELKIEGKMRDYIANVTGKSTGKINQINSINNNLCEEGKEAFKRGDINFTSAYETSRLPKGKQKEIISENLLSTEVKQMVKQERQKKEETKTVPAAVPEQEQEDEQLEGQLSFENYPELQTEDKIKAVSESDTKMEEINQIAEQEQQEELKRKDLKCLLENLLSLSEYITEEEKEQLKLINTACEERKYSIND